VAGELRTSLHLASEPHVSFGGFPFLTQVARGRLSSLTIEASGLRVRDVTFTHAVVTARDVSFGLGDLLSGRPTVIRGQGGSGSAIVSGTDASRALAGVAAGATVTFQGDRALLHLPQLGSPIPATLAIEGGKLELRPRSSALQPVSVQLPEVIPGVRYRGARVDGGALALTFDLDHPQFRIT
jgi:LmeA-like phospholipid-binding